MNESQNFVVLSSSAESINNHSLVMDFVTYESLITTTKAALTANIERGRNNSIFLNNFTSLLEDCGACISQSLCMAVDLLLDPNITLNKLIDCLDDAVCIIQMLSNFLKKVVESVSISCCSMKILPTTTGHILMNVFTHCKESESIYGSYLSKVEKQLKDLFRTCHELQLTYLMLLEKHFVFDLTETDEQEILIEALQINLKIGDIVQSLDVKTMAEQWKGFTMICEKYSNYLMDKNIYNDCTKILCSMITNNISNALEMQQDEKVIVRSLKVTSFIIKILLKVTHIFKYATARNIDHIVELMIYIYLHTESYLELVGTKSLQFMHLIRSNVLNPADSLLKELISHETFMSYMFNYNVNVIKEDDKLIGYIILLITIINITLQNPQKYTFSKRKLLMCVFDVVSHCHVWFNIGLKFKRTSNSDNSQYTCGLYEYLLTHATAIMVTLSSEEINIVKEYMYEILLSTDCYRALFISNLWILLSRMHDLELNELVVLCGVYQKLETNALFPNSPQQVHLSYTMSQLFKTMSNDDKLKLYKQFSPILDERNISLWIALRIENLPVDLQCRAQEEVIEKCKLLLDLLFNGRMRVQAEVFFLAKVMKLAATCSVITDVSMKNSIFKAWAKGCPNYNVNLLKDLDKSKIWYLKYIEALTLLTICAKDIVLDSNQDLIKVLHVISCIIQNGYAEIKLLLIELLCILTNHTEQDEHTYNVDCTIIETFKCLFQDSNVVVRNKLFRTLSHYAQHSNLEEIVSLAIRENHSLMEIWRQFVEHGTLKKYDYNDLKQQLMATKDFKHTHICLHNNVKSTQAVCKTSSSGNFEFADVDTFFNESDTEPVCKKAKLNTSELEDIICRLEMDTTLLCKLKENITEFEQTERIKNICDKLKKFTGLK
ncbi:uncharacterized protein C1orf112-like isoform X2 [Galleria mellonella]|uniref:Uncharacterized protein C1orf112-like isoform X2 n=1 Tax=Galleria mellonella TaxID=7137 RepID=A0A6J3C438_GALME|nr:uncharacterized protein C1orf112-like isoform X2 [Galleria mellonella]